MTKKKSEQIHAGRRAFERYGLNLTKDLRDRLVGQITNQRGKFLYRQSRRVSVWEIPLEDNFYKVVYDKLRHEIVTFLPKEEVQNVS